MLQLPRDKPVRTAEDYHIRVLVPCYKESLQILQVRHQPYRQCLEMAQNGLLDLASSRTMKFARGHACCNWRVEAVRPCMSIPHTTALASKLALQPLEHQVSVNQKKFVIMRACCSLELHSYPAHVDHVCCS